MEHGAGSTDNTEMLAQSKAFISLARSLGFSKVFLAPGGGLVGPRGILLGHAYLCRGQAGPTLILTTREPCLHFLAPTLSYLDQLSHYYLL